MKFIYKAKKGAKEIITGEIDVLSQQEALDKLLAQGLFPITIESASEASKSTGRGQVKKQRKKPITSKQVLIFTRKLTTLMRAKVELLSALRILYEQTENNLGLKDVILELYRDIKEGKTFFEALGRFPKVFSALYVNIIKAGEAAGRLDACLEQIVDYLTRQEGLKNKVLVALAYPVLLLFVGAASVFILFTFVIPKLRGMFEDMGMKLPLITKIVLKISAFSQKSWIWGLAAGVIFLFVLAGKTGLPAFFSRVAGKLKSGLPLIKGLSHNEELVRLSRSLHILLSSGVGILQALETASFGVEDLKLRRQLLEVCNSVKAGENLSRSLTIQTKLPDFFIKMVAVGEESGKLSDVLKEISEGYMQDVERDTAIITSLVEPAMILVLGVVLGSIIFAVFLPILQMTQMVK